MQSTTVLRPNLSRRKRRPRRVSRSVSERRRLCWSPAYSTLADRLVRDKKELCELAVERGALPKLADLIKEITPTEKTPEWQEEELESTACLREVNSHLLYNSHPLDVFP